MNVQYTNDIVPFFGSHWSARRVRFNALPYKARIALKNKKEVLLEGCPPFHGICTRKIVRINTRWYTRMP